jgi:hypothetical protein
MKWWLCEVLENEHHIELLQTKLYTLQRCYLDVGKSSNKERRVRQVYEAFGSRLQLHVSTERYTLEGKLAEWNVRIKALASLVI